MPAEDDDAERANCETLQHELGELEYIAQNGKSTTARMNARIEAEHLRAWIKEREARG